MTKQQIANAVDENQTADKARAKMSAEQKAAQAVAQLFLEPVTASNGEQRNRMVRVQGNVLRQMTTTLWHLASRQSEYMAQEKDKLRRMYEGYQGAEVQETQLLAQGQRLETIELGALQLQATFEAFRAQHDMLQNDAKYQWTPPAPRGSDRQAEPDEKAAEKIATLAARYGIETPDNKRTDGTGEAETRAA